MSVYGDQDTLVSSADVDQELFRLIVSLKNASYVIIKVFAEGFVVSLA
jgi:hypothetical protein